MNFRRPAAECLDFLGVEFEPFAILAFRCEALVPVLLNAHRIAGANLVDLGGSSGSWIASSYSPRPTELLLPML